MVKNKFVVLGLIVAIALSPVQGIAVGFANVRLQDIAGLCLVGHFALTQHRFEVDREYMTAVVPLFGLIVYASAMLPFQQFALGNTIPDLIELTSYAILLLVVYHYGSQLGRADIDRLLYFLFIVTVFSSIAAIIYYTLTGERFVGVIFIFGIAPFGFYYGVMYSLHKFDYGIVLGTILVFLRIILGQSRTLWVLMPIPLLYIAVTRRNEIRQNIAHVVSLGGVASAAIFIGFLLSPSTIGRFTSIVQASQGLFIRPVRWFSGFQLLSKYPLGTGLGTYSSTVSRAAVNEALSYPNWFTRVVGESLVSQQVSLYETGTASAHSDIFKFLVELGPIGLCLLVAFWALMIRRIVSVDYNWTTAVLVASVLFAMLRSFINPGILSGNTTWMFIFIAILAGHFTESVSY